jgi:inosose dehydratase
VTATHPHHVGATPLPERIAGAPISWGVCEVPGWGWQYDPATVLSQMSEIGLAATEFGPEGFLPEAPEDKARTLAEAGLEAVGQFVPVVLHDPARDPIPEVERALDGLVAAEATTLVLAAATGVEGYDSRPALDEAGWTTLLANVDRVAAAAGARGIVPTLHPHVGTMVESGEETQRVIEGSSIGICLDTGHLLIGGGDPVALARSHPGRIAHVHLKDVRAAVADRVRAGELSYTEAIRAGLYVPLGQGDVDVAAIVGALEDAGYDGWYVLEQDTILDGDPGANGPVRQVEESLDHLLALAAQWSGVGA